MAGIGELWAGSLTESGLVLDLCYARGAISAER